MEYSVPNDTWFCFSRRRSDLPQSNNFQRSMCVNPEDQNKHIRIGSLLFCHHNGLIFKISRDRQVLLIMIWNSTVLVFILYVLESFVVFFFLTMKLWYIMLTTTTDKCSLIFVFSQLSAGVFLWIACVFYSKLQVKLSQHFYSWRRNWAEPDLAKPDKKRSVNSFKISHI